MNSSPLLHIATCQFPVSGSVGRNLGYIGDLMREAERQKADIVHFSECALCGYAGTDLATLEDYQWEELERATDEICRLAKKLDIWVVLGSMHRRRKGKPYNCLYLISPEGEIVERYDKRFGTMGDLDHYTPGNRFVTFELKGVHCGLLICFDLRFPELYRALKKKGVQVIFQSFYNARQPGPSVHTHIMRQTMQCRAATNAFWVSMTNSSARYSPYPSCFIEPDGVIAGQLRPQRSGLMVNCIDLSKPFYDPAAPFRPMAMKGILSNKDYGG